MNPIERFEIALEHDIDEQYQYQPGECLRGAVLLHLSTSIKIKAIQVQIKGEAAVSWEEESNKVNSLSQFSSDETYIDVTQNLLEAPDQELLTLDRDKHRYPFEYVLPDNLPSSFIGKFGSITYVVKATLKEGKRFGLSTMITSEPFLMLRKLDISKEHRLLMKREDSVEKRIYGVLCCLTSGKVTANLVLNKTGHLPGEDIFMDAEIINSSPRTVKAVMASIIMHSSFHAKSTSRNNMQIVNKKRDEWEMAQGEGRRWKGVRLTIPPYIPESRLDGCDIIDIRYELLFRVDVSGGHELKITIPITVGTSNGEDIIERPTASLSDKGNTWTSHNSYSKLPNHEDSNANNIGNGSADIIPTGAHEQDIDVEVDEEHGGFRHPMDPGDTRQNPLFDQVIEDPEVQKERL